MAEEVFSVSLKLENHDLGERIGWSRDSKPAQRNNDVLMESASDVMIAQLSFQEWLATFKGKTDVVPSLKDYTMLPIFRVTTCNQALVKALKTQEGLPDCVEHVEPYTIKKELPPLPEMRSFSITLPSSISDVVGMLEDSTEDKIKDPFASAAAAVMVRQVELGEWLARFREVQVNPPLHVQTIVPMFTITTCDLALIEILSGKKNLPACIQKSEPYKEYDGLPFEVPKKGQNRPVSPPSATKWPFQPSA